MLQLRIEPDGDTQTLSLSGEFDLAGAELVEAELNAVFAAGEGEVVIDMSELTFIDSTGIAVLVSAIGRDGAAGRLRFIPSQAPAVTRVLELTGVDKRLPL